ncbi:MAG: CCA tRNA nucleotidyltransferase [Dehalococcoidia bacterium]|nr:MAG: CCA tRNA nucleotidyltransferase [Dehalococcoidia bacterium]
MPEKVNLADKIKKQLPAELVHFMQVGGEVAHNQGQSLYLVGGVVRDLLLGRTNLDLDLVVEGDAIKLAQQLTLSYPGKLTTHPRFNTASLKWDRWRVDLATARSETYLKLGALPTVCPSSIDSDLSRRDFTINAMAVGLNPDGYGELIDLYGGRCDLEHKLIRVLHQKSFSDDATRIWRGLRYQRRLGFQLEETTLSLLKRDIGMLATISGDRIRHELELVLKEEFPEKILLRADELNVLKWLHPSLKGNRWLAEKFQQARKLSATPPLELYLALLTYPLTAKENEQLISFLRLPKSLAQILRDSASIKAKLGLLSVPKLAPSRVYRLLYGYSPTAVIANMLASDSAVACRHIQLFLDKLRYIKPALSGQDLIKMGIPPSPTIKELLDKLHQAKLDGKVRSRKDEEELLRSFAPFNSPNPPA